MQARSLVSDVSSTVLRVRNYKDIHVASPYDCVKTKASVDSRAELGSLARKFEVKEEKGGFHNPMYGVVDYLLDEKPLRCLVSKDALASMYLAVVHTLTISSCWKVLRASICLRATVSLVSSTQGNNSVLTARIPSRGTYARRPAERH